MWAVESERVSPEVTGDMTYYLMAKEFGFTPEEVDSIKAERVESMLLIDSKVKEKERREFQKSQRRY